MPSADLAIVSITAFAAAAVGAITGSTSLVTVPVMLLVGMDAKTAVATNMLGVLCLSVGAMVPFARERQINPTIGLAIGSIPGSVVGALAALAISEVALRTIITVAMLAMALVLIARPRFGDDGQARTAFLRAAGYAAMTVWGVYGGLFSGGYATVLTVACVAFFGLPFVNAVAVTKVVNFAGSLAAVAVFAAERRIDWRVGLAVGATSLAGGWMGARLAIERGTAWIRRVFVLVVSALAVKLLYQLIAS